MSGVSAVATGATGAGLRAYAGSMHYDAHQPVINDLEARIVTIRDSL
ncbi:MAG: hypothetical protein ACOYN0_04870 [Phycisphaerales bacterium]